MASADEEATQTHASEWQRNSERVSHGSSASGRADHTVWPLRIMGHLSRRRTAGRLSEQTAIGLAVTQIVNF
jgi:hypothetical protein